MKFSEFEHRLLKLKNKSLPGIKSHIELVPIDRLKSIKEEVKIAKKDAAVSLCFFSDSNYETRLPFILRNNYEGVHSNQISFPGGKKEKLDEDLIETARRETNEEIGLNKDEMKLQFKLTDIYIPPSNFLVTPYLTFDNFYPNFKLDKREVADHIQLPLFKLLELEIEKRFLDEGPQKGIEVPCFYYKNNLIWGATAMILSEFKIFLTSISSN